MRRTTTLIFIFLSTLAVQAGDDYLNNHLSLSGALDSLISTYNPNEFDNKMGQMKSAHLYLKVEESIDNNGETTKKIEMSVESPDLEQAIVCLYTEKYKGSILSGATSSRECKYN